jgi:hypothetical protein
MSRVPTPSPITSTFRALKDSPASDDYPPLFNRRSNTPKGLHGKNSFNLWVHTDRDFRQELVLHPDHFHGLQVGDLVEIVACKDDEKDVSGHSRNISVESQEFAGKHASHASGGSLPPFRRGGSVLFDEPRPSKRLIMKVNSLDRELVARQPQLQISVDKTVAQSFDLPPRSDVLVRKIDAESVTADYVELMFRDQYIGRADMWRLKNFVNQTTVFVGKKILFAGVIRARINEIYINGHLVDSAYIGQGTKVMFRSETAKFFIFIQMSKEMWDFDEDGELYQEKLLDGFLPDLFDQWRRVGTNHAVSIILFTRVIYTPGEAPIHDPTVVRNDQTGNYTKDFYRVVIDFDSRSDWNTVLVQLKKDFSNYVKDVLEHRSDDADDLEKVVGGQIASATEGNVLEAVNLALNPFDRHYVDRDLLRTGLSIVIITPGTGYFETTKGVLRMTSERMVDNGIALDLVCLSKQPLFTVPLFQYLSAEMPDVPTPSQDDLHRSPSASIPASQQRSFTLRDPDQPAVFSRRSVMQGSQSESNQFLDNPLWDPLEYEASDNGAHLKAFYSIPHWVDVSFWHRQDDEVTTRFALRCKMHEIQMMSVMDEIGSNITVPPLQLRKSKHLDEYDTYDASLFEDVEHDNSPTPSASGSPQPSSFRMMPSSFDSPRVLLSTSPKVLSGSPPRSFRGSMEEATIDFRRINLGPQDQRLSSSSLSSSFAPQWSAAMTKLINPCNPNKNVMKMNSAIRRWRHIFPRLEQYTEDDPEMNWKSLCSPASLPLTTDFFPTPEELAKYYQEYTYSLAPSYEVQLDQKARLENLLLELVYQRLNQGYQIVVAPNPSETTGFQRGPRVPGVAFNAANPGFSTGGGLKPGKHQNAYYLSLGDNLHRISSDNFGNNVEVTRYMRKDLRNRDDCLVHRCVIWPRHGDAYVQRIVQFRPTNFVSYNWNYMDHLIAGYEVDMVESLRFWRSRFLLIPMDAPPSSLLLPANDHLDEEELRLAGFFKFLELFEKAQVDEDGKSVPNASLSLQLTTYYPASFIVNDWQRPNLEVSPIQGQDAKVVLKKTSSLQEVADAMKAPGGVLFKDRNWHFQTYESTFLGSECVDWLVSAFADISTREEAVQFGDQLLERGFFIHVKQKHRFQDGYYYYRLQPEYAPARRLVKQPSFGSSKKTPDMRVRHASGDGKWDSNVAAFEMTRRILVDMDPQKRSDRREIASLHYDTVYTPKGCYHFQLHWLSCTARLMEDVLLTWARFAEKCGMRMVEAPVEQTLGFSEHNPFQSVIPISLALAPPTDVQSPVGVPDLWFESELLRSHGFLLDVENDDQFPPGSVTYSFAKPKYAHTQFVHRSGVAFVRFSHVADLFRRCRF